MTEKRNLLDEAKELGGVFVNNENIICINEIFYKYKNGIWEQQSDKLIQAWICEKAQELFGPIRKNQVKEIIMNIENNTYITYEDYFLNPPKHDDTINMKSGILDLKTFKLKKYELSDMIFQKLPFDYNPKNNKLDMWYKFLSTMMGWKDIVPDKEDYKIVMYFIQEFMGYTLLTGNPRGSNLIMTGRGQNGKGTLMEIWKAMLGKHNCSNVDMREINNPSMYYIMNTKDKLVNFCGDSSKGQIDTSIMKTAAVGETVTGRMIHKAPIEFPFSANFVILCNDPPWIGNPDKALKRRYFILPCDYIVPDKDRIVGLANKIIESEIESIFAWSVKGLKRLNERDYFLPPERADKTMNEYLMMNDNIQEWLEEEDMMNEKSKCKPIHLFRYYVLYCEESKYKPLGKKNFYKRLENKNFKKKILNGTEYFLGLKTPDNISIIER